MAPENDLECHHWPIYHTVSTTALDSEEFSVILNPRNRRFQLQTEACHPDRNREGKGCDQVGGKEWERCRGLSKQKRCKQTIGKTEGKRMRLNERNRLVLRRSVL